LIDLLTAENASLESNRSIKNNELTTTKITKNNNEITKLATYNGVTIILGSVIAFFFNKTVYYVYGASSNELRQYMPNYLLQ